MSYTKRFRLVPEWDAPLENPRLGLSPSSAVASGCSILAPEKIGTCRHVLYQTLCSMYSLKYTLSCLSCSVVCFCELSSWCRRLIKCFNCSLSVPRFVSASAAVGLQNTKASELEANHQTHRAVHKVFRIAGNYTWEVVAQDVVWLHSAPLRGVDAGTLLPAPWPRAGAAVPAQLWIGYGCPPFLLASPGACQPLSLPAEQPARAAALPSGSPVTTDHTMSAFLQHHISLCACERLLSVVFLAPVPSVSATSAAQPGAPLSEICKWQPAKTPALSAAHSFHPPTPALSYKSCKDRMNNDSDLHKMVRFHVMVASHLTFFSSTTLCWRASALLFSRCISLLKLSRLFLFCSSSIPQCTCTVSTFSTSHFLLSSSTALRTWMGVYCAYHAIMLKKTAYFRQRIIRVSEYLFQGFYMQLLFAALCLLLLLIQRIHQLLYHFLF